MVLEAARVTGFEPTIKGECVLPAQSEARETLLNMQQALLETNRVLHGPEYYSFVKNMFDFIGGTSTPTEDRSNPMPGPEGSSFTFVLKHVEGTHGRIWTRQAMIIEEKPIASGITEVQEYIWPVNLGGPESTRRLHFDNPHILDSTVLDHKNLPALQNVGLSSHEMVTVLSVTDMSKRILDQAIKTPQPQAATL